MFAKYVYHVDGIDSAYYVSDSQGGQSQTLVFLHWWMSNAKHFLSCGEMLSKQWSRVILLDLPWFGASQEPNSERSVADYGSRLDHILEHIASQYHVEKYILIAHSFWWRVSIQTVSDHWSYTSKHIDKLVLLASWWLNTPTNPKLARVITNINKLLQNGGKIGTILYTLLHRIARLVYSSDYRKVSPTMQRIFTQTVWYNQHHLLSRIEVPTLIIQWENDNQIPISDARYFHQQMANSKLILIPNAGHFSFIEYPEEVLAHISWFIRT